MTHPVLAALRSPSTAARRDACRAAAKEPSAVLLIDALVATLSDNDASVVRSAAASLERIGRKHDAVLPALRGALRNANLAHRLEAAWTLARLEPPPLLLLPALASALDAARGDARWRAARLLVELGRLHEEVLPVIVELAGPKASVRERRIALAALRELAPGDPRVVDAHVAASRAADPGLRRFALIGLAGLDAASDEIGSQIEALAGDPDARVRAAAARAMELRTAQKSR